MELRDIQNGDWDTVADSMSSVNQEPGWDAWAMLGRGEAQGELKFGTLKH
jgi:hypothetical protein